MSGWISLILHVFGIQSEVIGLSGSDVFWLDITLTLTLLMPMTSMIIMKIRSRSK